MSVSLILFFYMRFKINKMYANCSQLIFGKTMSRIRRRASAGVDQNGVQDNFNHNEFY